MFWNRILPGEGEILHLSPGRRARMLSVLKQKLEPPATAISQAKPSEDIPRIESSGRVPPRVQISSPGVSFEKREPEKIAQTGGEKPELPRTVSPTDAMPAKGRSSGKLMRRT